MRKNTRKDFSQTALAVVEKSIGEKLKPVTTEAMQKVPVAFVIMTPAKQSFGVRTPPGYDCTKNRELIDAAYEAAQFYFTMTLEELSGLKTPRPS